MKFHTFVILVVSLVAAAILATSAFGGSNTLAVTQQDALSDSGVQPQAYASSTAYCPSGTTPTGGGWTVTKPFVNLVTSSAMVSNLNGIGWRVTMYDDNTSQAGSFKAWVICGRTL